MNIVGVQASQIMDIWPQVREHFASFEERSQGELTAQELAQLVMTTHRQCWVAVDDGKIVATALTRIENNPQQTVCLDFCAGEGRDGWRDALVDEIERWAVHMKSKRVRIVCRPGWTKELRTLGYKESHRVLEKDI